MKSLVKRNYFLLLTLLSFSSFAQTAQDTKAQIEKIFSRYLPQNPGCQFSVSKNDSVIFSKAFGMADLEHNAPLTMNSIIEGGSISKQFTAAAILLLEQQGKLSVEDDIRKYIPELPDYGTVIKLKHLLHHTSGIKDWGAIARLTGWDRGTKTYSNDDVLEIVSLQKTLNNIPGAEFLYSNSNFNLLAIVVKRVSGMSLAEYTKQYIFIPAGMEHTQWRDNYKRVVPNRAIAYEKKGSGYEMDMPYENAYGSGGLLTTTEDLLKWNSFYLSGKLGDPSILQKQIAVDTLNNGSINDYGAGLYIQTNKGLKVMRHSGITGSYRSYLEYYPSLNLSIAWLSNTTQFGNSLISDVENIFIKDTTTATKKKKDTIQQPVVLLVKPDLQTMQEYVGKYFSDETGSGMKVSIKNDTLVMNINSYTAAKLRPTSTDAFQIIGTGTEVIFERDEKNQITKFKISQTRARNVEFVKQKDL